MRLMGVLRMDCERMEQYECVDKARQMLKDKEFVLVYDGESGIHKGLLTRKDIVDKSKNLVIDCLTTKDSVTTDCKIYDALQMMKEQSLPALEVYENTTFKGVVSRNDIITYIERENTEIRQKLQTQINDLQAKISEKDLEIGSLRDDSFENKDDKHNYFLAVSHEIRNYLNGLMGFAQLLYETEESSDKLESIEMIIRSSNSILEIVNGVLTMGKIKCGKFQIMEKKTELYGYFNNLIKIHENHAKLKGLGFCANIDNHLKRDFLADVNSLTLIINNLLSNSIKFTNTGFIEFSTYLIPTDNDVTNVLELRVVDTGIGINAENPESLFNIFEQGQSLSDVKSCGSGLGLAIVKELVDLMSGKILIHGKPNIGTELIVSLPIKSL